MSSIACQSWLSAIRPGCIRAAARQGRYQNHNPIHKQRHLPGRRANSGFANQSRPSWIPSRVLLASTAAAVGSYIVATQINGTADISRVKKPAYATQKQFIRAIEEIRAALGDHTISVDEHDLHSHGFSAFSSFNIDSYPWAVAYPTSTEEVSTIARICHEHKVPMIPFSGGSSLEANFSAPYGGLSVDFSHMDEILELHENDMDVVVQPSVPWMTLNEEIKSSGLFFPIDPGPTAQVGGMVGTNCSGTNAVRYGTMRDWVINLTVVLADGTIIKTRKRPRKSSAGYNLTNLFVGSEGTLGFVTEITLKLAVIPKETSVAVVTFPSIREAASAASKILRAGVPLQAIELMDDVQMKVINQTNVTKKTWEELPTMFFKFSGTRAGVEENIATVKSIAREHHCGKFTFAFDEKERDLLWSARKESLWSMLSLVQDNSKSVYSTDIAVPISRLADLIEVSKQELDELGLFASILGHIGDGNFHKSILYDREDPKQVAAIDKCVKDMVDRALEMEGTCSGEHGIGLSKRKYLEKELGPDTINVMKSIKAALDPYWLMNPGKIIDIPQ